MQAFNAQIAVDAEAQVIVAAELTQSPNDARQLVPMAQAIVDNVGKLAETTSADEPVFGQIKEARGLRRLLLRGFAAARAEFRLIATTHNLLKLFRSGRPRALLTARPQTPAPRR